MIDTGEKVSALQLFPIKSIQAATINGKEPNCLTIGRSGFEHDGVRDRGMVLIDENGLFVSQRGWDEKHAVKYSGDSILACMAIDIKVDYVQVSAPDGGKLKIPHVSVQREESKCFDIFGKEFYGFEIHNDAAGFFSKYLNRGVKLYQYDISKPRWLSSQYHRKNASNRMAGADGHPFLWMRQSSLDILHDHAHIPRGTKALLDWRANILSSGHIDMPQNTPDAQVYLPEDFVDELVIGGLSSYCTKPCERCPIPNINQRTGELDRLSTKLLARTRSGRNATDSNESKNCPMFGENLNHKIISIGKEVRVGDEVTILRWLPRPNINLK